MDIFGEIKRVDKKRQKESFDFSADDFARIRSIVESNLGKINEQDSNREYNFVEFFEEFGDIILDGLSEKERMIYIQVITKTMKENPLESLLNKESDPM